MFHLFVFFFQLRYQYVRHINLEFSQDVEDKNLQDVKSKVALKHYWKSEKADILLGNRPFTFTLDSEVSIFHSY